MEAFPPPGWQEFAPVRRLGSGGVWLARAGDAHAVLRQLAAPTAEWLDRLRVDGVPRLLRRETATGWTALEYIPGDTLRRELRRRGQLPPGEALEAVVRTARILARVWEESGWLHRDLKPEHLCRRSDGAYAVLDWHLAAPPQQPLDAGRRVGTPAYLSPEACAGAPLDSASDQYSLGITLFELLTGKRPYPRRTWRTMMQAHLSEELPPTPGVAPELRQLLERMTAKFPDQRYADWYELIEAADGLF